MTFTPLRTRLEQALQTIEGLEREKVDLLKALENVLAEIEALASTISTPVSDQTATVVRDAIAVVRTTYERE